jgi:hypothetical protein
MSGGPVFAQMDDGNLYVAGVVVSSSGDPQSGTATGGIRAINSKAATFIRTYLP